MSLVVPVRLHQGQDGSHIQCDTQVVPLVDFQFVFDV